LFLDLFLAFLFDLCDRLSSFKLHVKSQHLPVVVVVVVTREYSFLSATIITELLQMLVPFIS